MKKKWLFLLAGTLVALSILAGCATPINAQRVEFTPYGKGAAVQQVRMLHTVDVMLDSRYRRQIQQNSLWRLRGVVPQGSVYSAENAVFTIEGRQVHEAYLVLSGTALVGFYLPGEFNFSPLSVPLSLTFESEQHD